MSLSLSLLVALAYVILVWLLSLARKDISVVDVFWGLGFVLLAAGYFVFTDGFIGRKVLVSSPAANPERIVPPRG